MATELLPSRSDMGSQEAVPPPRAYGSTEDLSWPVIALRAVQRFGTPCYVTRLRPVIDAVREVEAGHSLPVRSWLSMKTHPLAHLVRWWAANGRGVEVVSETEFCTARAAGCSVDQILVNGVAKQAWLPRQELPRLRVHFDSVGELDALLSLAVQREWRTGIRLHAPDERDARDAQFGGQFGMTAAEAVTSIRRLRRAGARVESIHFHLGQGQHEPGAYGRAVAHAGRVCKDAEFSPKYLDCGGGLPSRARAEERLADLRSAIDSGRQELGPQLEEVWLENGRFLTEDSTVLAVRVLDSKERLEGRYLICDGGRTNQALAADHGLHQIRTLPSRSGTGRFTTICGPTCMTDDVLGRMLLPEDVRPGDVLLWMDAGAYHLPWETRFSQGLAAIAWCDESDTPILARERERPEAGAQSWIL